MKRFYGLLLLALVAVAPKLSAQSLQFSGDSYHRAFVSYSALNMNWDKGGNVNAHLFPLTTGISLGYLESAKLFDLSFPLLVEYGVSLQYNTGNEIEFPIGASSEASSEYRVNTLAMNVPVHAALNLKLNKVSINPYLGVNFRINLLGNQTTTNKLGNTTTTTKMRLFDDSDEKGAAGDAAWERFQAGLSYGVALRFGAITLSAGITSDLMPLVDRGEELNAMAELKSVSLGFAF
jgi:hypothetical protein